jgi:hypothetical protein
MTKRDFALMLAASSMIVVAAIWLWSAEVVELVATGDVELLGIVANMIHMPEA